jgi:TPR repeat protein
MLSRASAFIAFLLLFSIATSAGAETRRAFLVGVQRYNDPKIQQLSRTVTDAKDLALDLTEVDFDKKNIKVVADPKNRDEFEKELDAFLKTVEAGDDVLFYYSGHGFGIEADQTNYLLLGDIKSPFAYTQSQLPDKEQHNREIVQLRVSSYIDSYQRNEIPRSGISTKEIQEKIAARHPKVAIVILDACRSLLAPEPSADGNVKRLKRGSDSGSRLLDSGHPPQGFMVLFSASFGEQAIERFDDYDHRRNSLFTEVVRSELLRPGQTLLEFAKRVSLVTRAIAEKKGAQQEPEYFSNGYDAENYLFIGSIGRERFELTQDRCAGASEDWGQIAKLRKREFFRRHIQRFDSCATAELARRALANLGLTSDDPVVVPAADPRRPISDCDRLAASDLDPARPPEVPGVAFDNIDAEQAITACNKEIKANPLVARFLFNVGRAYQQLASQPGLDPGKVTVALRKARLNYNDARDKGYVSALNNLAILDESSPSEDTKNGEESRLLKQAAEQGLPLAMYNLGLHYKYGIGDIQQDITQAVEWFAKAAESGLVSAMVERGEALQRGLSTGGADGRRAIEWYQRAADAGSVRARLNLGLLYYKGVRGQFKDPGQALLWFGRAAASDDGAAEYNLAVIMESGEGMARPEPEIAERYWRLAAYAGDSDAQIELADRLMDGRVLIKPQDGPREAVTLLGRAMSQGSPQAALYLARIYQNGLLGQNKDAIKAMRMAYKAIELSTQADPTTTDGDPFMEIAAGHLLAEMAKTGQAVDTSGRPLLTQDEVDRIEHYYGKVDPMTRRVKAGRLSVPIRCDAFPGFEMKQLVWIWDWGRNESPTEPQFRKIERDSDCSDHELRGTMISVFEEAKKNNVPFTDLLDQRIKTAKEDMALGKKQR